MPGPYTLTGSGTQSIGAPGKLSIALTGIANPPVSAGRATPRNLYNAGIIRWGNANGYYGTLGLDADLQQVDLPPGMTLLGYYLNQGVQAVVTELAAAAHDISLPIPHVLSPMSECAIGIELLEVSNNTISSGAWPTANIALYYPVRLTAPFSCASVWVYVGSTSSGHWDVGIFDDAFALLAHTGSQVEGSINALQTVALALSLSAGKYYIAMSADVTTLTTQRLGLNLPTMRISGIRQSASSFPLASGPTLVTPTATSIPLFGIADFAL